jgi:hypothetical protein
MSSESVARAYLGTTRVLSTPGTPDATSMTTTDYFLLADEGLKPEKERTSC